MGPTHQAHGELSPLTESLRSKDPAVESMHDFFNQVREGFVIAHLSTERKDGTWKLRVMSHAIWGPSKADGNSGASN